MKERMIAVLMTIAMLFGCVGNMSAVSAAEGDSGKYYLRSDYAVSSEGVASDETKTDKATGEPQIDVISGTTAKVVVEADQLSEMSAAVINYAQSGGTLDVKLTALTSADEAQGVELAHKVLQVADGYHTRTSESLIFEQTAPAAAKFLKVELAVNGSLDGKSYVNYVEVSRKVKPVMQWKSAANGNVLDITASGTDNGNTVTASAASDAKSQTWSLRESEEKGWYNILNENSGKGMGLFGGTAAAGEEPIQWTIDGGANQFWRFVEVVKAGKTYYKILNKSSKLVLTVNDHKVTQEADTGADNQLFEAVMVQGTADFGSKYNDNYSVSNISASAENYVISYNASYSLQTGMYFEIVLSDGQKSSNAKGTFTVSGDGEYTLTASLYEDSTKAVKVCDSFSKTISLKNGEYKIVGAQWTCTTEQTPWSDNGAIQLRNVTDEQVEEIKASAGDYIVVDQNTRYQAMDSHPWGGCFNEKGWYAMRDLTDEERESVIKALFDPNTDGLHFTAGRTPIGASDFGLTMYTYADEWDDYDMSSFTIEQDKVHLIPFIKSAMKYVPDMPIFSSPWTPPAWMKTNNKLNGVESGWPGIEDTKENFEAYATYFVKYLDAYAKEGIDLYAVTPQNEPTMNTPYPSCVWNGNQLNVFLRDYLCDAVDEYNKANDKNVEVWLGTFTDSNQSMVWPTYKDPVTSAKVDAYCFQWWGAPLATKLYAQSKAESGTPVKMIQSESKCGGGDNSWRYAEEQFDCYKEFLDAGVSQYHLWNMILEGNGENNAEPANRRWPQNAPISVNGKDIRYNPSYYQVKHFSSNIEGGARRIKVEGNNLGEGSVSGYVQDVRAIGFQNTDGEVVLNVKNSTASAKAVTVVVNHEAFDVTVPAHSINTFKVDGTYENTEDATESVETEETTNMKFTSAATGDLLSAEGYANGDVINTASNRGESNQTWKLVKASNEGYYHLVNFATDLGVAVWNGVTTEGAEIKQYENTGAPDQQWALEFVEYRGEGAERKAYYKLVNYKSKLVLTALGESDNKALTQKAYTGTDDQLWTLDVVGGEWTFPDDPDKEVDKTALAAAIKAALPDTEADKYTAESWTAYKEALTKAKAINDKADATQTEVDGAVQKLTEAQEALEKVGENPQPARPFVDVDKKAWYYDTVYYNYDAGSMTGKDETHFAPEEPLVRAQFATVLWKMNGSEDVAYTPEFPDVTKEDWCATAVLWAKRTKVVTGYTDTGFFGANDKINREQMAVMMYRYAKYKGYSQEGGVDYSDYPDAANVQGYAQEAMKWAVGNGIMTGKTVNGKLYLDPQGEAIRAECAKIIQNFKEKYEK